MQRKETMILFLFQFKLVLQLSGKERFSRPCFESTDVFTTTEINGTIGESQCGIRLSVG